MTSLPDEANCLSGRRGEEEEDEEEEEEEEGHMCTFMSMHVCAFMSHKYVHIHKWEQFSIKGRIGGQQTLSIVEGWGVLKIDAGRRWAKRKDGKQKSRCEEGTLPSDIKKTSHYQRA